MSTHNQIADRYDISLLKSMLELYFVRVRNWRKLATNRTGIIAYQENVKENPLEVYLPETTNLTNSMHLIQSALNVVSFIEEKPTASIVQSLSSPDKDLCDCRVISASSNTASVMLVENILHTTMDSLATYYLAEQRMYLASLAKEQKRRMRKASEYQNIFEKSCQFAHTWKGSFGITLIVPLNIFSFGLFDELQPANQSRKAFEKYLGCLSSVDYANKDGSASYIVDNNNDKSSQRVLRNIESLHGIMKKDTFEVSGRLSPLMKQVDEKYNYRKPVCIDTPSIEIVSKALEQMNPEPDSYEEVFLGFPTMLSADMEDLTIDSNVPSFFSDIEPGHRKVKVRGVGKHIQQATLIVELSRADYSKALTAQSQVCHVAMKCTVKRKPHRGWEVIKLHSFELVEDGIDSSNTHFSSLSQGN